MSAVLNVTCREHGLIWSAAVECRHEAEDELRRVTHAHSAIYGADCHSIVDVEILDPVTMKPTSSVARSVIPPQRASDEPTPPNARDEGGD